MFRYLTLDAERMEVSITLPVSKNDPLGSGAVRTLGCLCSVSPGICPFHVASEHVEFVRGQHWDVATEELTLFPTVDGMVCSKQSVVDTIKGFVIDMKMPVLGPSGEELYGGHSFRTGGAVFLASIGLDVQRIQLLGRWFSNVVER